MFTPETVQLPTRSERVKQFTEQARDPNSEPLPSHPRPMTRAEVLFIVKMNVEELMELLVTVPPEDMGSDDRPEILALRDLQKIVDNARLPSPSKATTPDERIAEQIDAFVDIDYYNCNAACKVGANVDDVFNVVHEQGNMSKRFPDGTFHRNDEGKIIKPPDWKEPDVLSVVQGWSLYGTW